MRVTVYDKNPGPRTMDKFLRFTWWLGCWFQKLIGAVDAYKGVTSWQEAQDWLLAQPAPLTMVQYWGHGSPGTIWISQQPTNAAHWKALKPQMATDSIVWFRVCSSIQGDRGYAFAIELSNALNCTVAGHTRIIGVFQGGLHTLKPGAIASWPLTEGEFKDSKLAGMGLKWGNNTVICLATKIPKGW